MKAEPTQEQLGEIIYLFSNGNLDAASAHAEKLLGSFPDSFDCINLLATVNSACGRLEAAKELFDRAEAINPTFAPMLANFGDLLFKLGDFQEAQKTLTRAIDIDTRNSSALNNLGNINAAQGDHQAAIRFFEKADRCNIRNSDAPILNWARSLLAMGEVAGAKKKLEKFSSTHRPTADSEIIWGSLELSDGNLTGALEHFENATALNASYGLAHYNLGLTNLLMEKSEPAIRHFERARATGYASTELFRNLGIAYQSEGFNSLAADAFRKAIEVDPDNPELIASWCENLRLSNSYKTDHWETLRRAIQKHPEYYPLYLTSCLFSNYTGILRSEVFSYHKAFGDQFSQVAVTPTADQLSLCEDKIRIGYVSPDFNKHSVAYFFEPLISNHNKDKVEVFCYYNNTKVDETTERLQQHADHWRSTVGLNDAQLVELIQNDGIHILVDLAGHTDKNRLTAFAYKPAPIQVTWLGYPNTTGLDAVDYRFTDDIADPIGDSEDFHTEELVRLPDGMWCYSGDNTIKANEELPYNRNGYITFGSFNNLAKVTPQVVELWANILKAVPKSKLLLKAKQLGEEEAKNRFIALFEEHGVSPDQLELRGSLSLTEKHLDLYGEVDIALDPFPFNGATTTCEALWMGVPVLTLRGDRHVGRVGASLVHRVGLDAFIAETEEDYLNKAIAHASDTKALSALRLDMRQRVQQSPLCDPKLFTKHIENAFSYMWERLDASTK